MHKESIVNFSNGMQVIVWKTGSEVGLGVVDEQGFVVTDKKLSVSEADKLSWVTNNKFCLS